MPELECALTNRDDLVPRYLARRLSEQEQEAFEAHFLTCARCQHDLELGLAVRGLLPRQPRVRWRGWAAVGSLAAAAAIGALLLLPSRGGSEALRALGAVRQAPIYLGIPIRAGTPSLTDSLFAAGMTQYLDEHYERATGELEKAVRAGPDAAPLEFFLAASLLMTGHAAEAAAGFAKTVALGDTPYRAEAHFYRAKALLQLGRRTDAERELAEAVKSGGVIGAYAKSLTDSLQGIGRR